MHWRIVTDGLLYIDHLFETEEIQSQWSDCDHAIAREFTINFVL